MESTCSTNSSACCCIRRELCVTPVIAVPVDGIMDISLLVDVHGPIQWNAVVFIVVYGHSGHPCDGAVIQSNID